MSIKTYEIFTEAFSEIVQADDIPTALNKFFWDNQGAGQIIMIVNKAFPELLNSGSSFGNSIEQRLIIAQDNYIRFLSNAYNKTFHFAHIHHYNEHEEDIKKGERLRGEIAMLQDLLNPEQGVKVSDITESDSSNTA